MEDITNLAYWYPKVKHLVPTPKTEIVETDCNLIEILDGEAPNEWRGFIEDMRVAIGRLGGCPVFLRTGHTSNKHEWSDTCYLADVKDLGQHIYNLVEFSECVDMIGLPYKTWIERELLPVMPVFYAFKGMPITQEFRYFVKDGEVDHRQPYWPPEAFLKSYSNAEKEWEKLLAEISVLDKVSDKELTAMTEKIGKALGGYWSVDWLLTDRGWYMTDMAEGAMSYKWQAEGFYLEKLPEGKELE